MNVCVKERESCLEVGGGGHCVITLWQQLIYIFYIEHINKNIFLKEALYLRNF